MNLNCKNNSDDIILLELSLIVCFVLYGFKDWFDLGGEEMKEGYISRYRNGGIRCFGFLVREVIVF